MRQVSCILQDSKGFMWFGTAEGLHNYDGYDFTVYEHDPENAHSLSDNTVHSIYEDSSGVLWIGTANGLNKFDREREQFIQHQHDPDDPGSLSNSNVSSVYEDDSGLLWVGTFGGGLNAFDPENESFLTYQNDSTHPDSLSSNSVSSVYVDRSGVLWVGTLRGGLNRFDREREQFIRFKNNVRDPHSLSNNDVSLVYEGQSGALWIGTLGGGLNKFDRHTESFVRYPRAPGDPRSLIHNIVRSIHEDQSGVLWIATDDGLTRFDPATEESTRYRHDLLDPASLSDNLVLSVYEDRAGVLWVGTLGEGVDKFDQATHQFVGYESDPKDPQTLSNNVVWSIYEDHSGVLWIGTNDGLNALRRETAQMTHYNSDPHDPRSLSGNVVRVVYEDRQGVLWIGTDAGLDRFDRDTGHFSHYRHDANDPHSLSSNTVGVIYEDQSGVLWIGTTGGLNGFDRESERFVRYRHDANDDHSLSANTVEAIYEDRSGVLWIGTTGGLNRFDRQNERFIHYRSDPGDPRSLSSDKVLSIHEDRTAVLWIATYGGGLNRFDPVEETFVHYEEKDGLPSDVVYGILEDDQGDLWLSTNRGLSRFDPRRETFKNYEVRDGLQSNEFNPNAYHKSSSGEMFFGGINGFNAFDPEDVKDNPCVPPVVLTSLTQGGEDLQAGRAADSIEAATLNWPSNFFEFEFAALSYLQPEENQYAYMLEGFDEDWNYTGSRRFGKYTNLPGGTYTLRVKGSNNDGIWNEEGMSLTVTVVPPFWATWWFRAAAGLLLAGAVLGGYRLRLSSIQARSRELEAQVEERTYEIERRRQELEALFRADEEMHRHLQLDQVLQALADVAVDILEANKSAVLVWDEGRERLVMTVARGFSPEAMAQLSYARGEGITGHVAETGDPVVVEDWLADPRREGERAESLRVIDSEGIRCFMHLPIKVDDQIFGVFNVSYTEPHAFGEDEQRLFLALAQRAALAIQTAHRFDEEERRAEQFRVISEVGRRITSILAVDELLNQMASLIKEAFNYYHVGFGLTEADDVVSRAEVGACRDAYQGARLKVGQEGVWGWVAQSGEPLLVPDASQEPRFRFVPQAAEIRSELCVPLKTKEAVIGVLSVESDQPNAFDESDLVVLQSLANQAAIAVENARLYEDTKSRLAQVTALQETTRAAASTLELDRLLNLITEQATTLLQADGGMLNLVDWDKNEDHVVAATGFAFSALRDGSPLEGSLSGWVTLHNQPVISNQLQDDSRVDPRAFSRTWGETKRQLRSAAVAPLTIKDQVMGTVVLMDKQGGQGEFHQADLDLLVAFANQAATAIENARLFDAEQRRAEQFRLLSEVGRHITSILDVDELLVEIVRLLEDTFGYYQITIGLIEGDDLVFRAGAKTDWDDGQFRPPSVKVGEEGITGWVAGTGEPLLAPDVSKEPRYLLLPESRETRSELAVPLTTTTGVIGVLNVESAQLNAFDETDLAVLQSLANLAAVAIENARFFHAEQRRAEQFRLLSEVGARITSLLAVDELLYEVARLVNETLGYYLVGVGLIEGDELVVKAGAGPRWDAPEFQLPRIKVGEGVSGRVAATGEPLLARDVSQDPRYLLLPDSSDTQSELAVPLKTKSGVIGVLDVQSDQLNAFDESDLAVLQSLANLAAIAIEEARLFDAEQRRAEQFRAISEVGGYMISILAVDDLLGEIVRSVKESLGYYHTAIGLIEADELVIKAGAGAHWDEPDFKPTRLKVGGKGITAWVAASGEPLLVPDVTHEPRYLPVPASSGIRSELAVPLRTKTGVIGVLDVQSDRLNAFDDSDLMVLQSLAHQAAIAIENARLYEQAQQAAVVEERSRLARDLHDAVTQTLFSASLIAEVLPTLWESDQAEGRQLLKELRQLSRGALAEMRTLLLELRPAALLERSLDDLLRQLAEAVTGRTGVPVTVSIEGQSDLPSDVHVALYRIAQEALNNVVKHAHASQVRVRLHCTSGLPDEVDTEPPERLELQVSDDGRGFDPARVAPDHLGLGIIRERAQAVGATVEIESHPGHGTEVTVVWKG